MLSVGAVFAQVSPPNLFINELVAVPHQIIHDSKGEYDDWIEIYNAGDTAVCIAGYYITDDLSNPKKANIDSRFKQFTTIPPKGYLLLWLDKGTKGSPPIHISLKLSGTGEQVGLYTPKGQLIDSVTFGPQKPNVSYGRLGDGNTKWAFTKFPTPKTANTFDTVVFTPPPMFNLSSGFYSNAISVVIQGEEKKDTIKYTLDGTTPNEQNGFIYDKPLLIGTTTVVRAVIYKKGKLTSRPTTHTYFINDSCSLPILSLATDSIKTLLRTDAGNGYRGENPLHLEFFEQEKSSFKLNGGFRLQGLAIRYYPQKSLAIRFRVNYGAEKLSYPLFPQKPHLTRFYDFSLRGSGNDNNRTLFRDGLMHSLVDKNMHIDYLSYRPVVVYVNGKYWGIHNIREKISRYYLETNHPKIGKRAELLEWKAAPIQGDPTHYNKMWHFADSNDLSDPANYDSISSWMDIDNYIDYFIAETFYGNNDWPMANIKYWRPSKKEGKWRWIMFDLDLAFNFRANRCPGHHTSIQYVLGVNNCHLPHLDHALMESTILFRALIKNDTFRKHFITRYTDILNTNFKSERVTRVIQALHDSLAPEMPRHIKRWSDKRGIRNMNTWKREVGELLRFAEERPDTIRKFLSEAFDLGDSIQLQFNINNPKGGTIQVNTITPDQFPFVGTFFEKMEIQLIAKPAKGYVFKEWKETRETDSIIKLSTNKQEIYTAIFELVD